MKGSQSSSYTFIFYQTSTAPVGDGGIERGSGGMSSDVEEALSTEDQQSKDKYKVSSALKVRMNSA